MEFLTDEQFKQLSKPGVTSLQLLSPHNSASNRVTITRVTVDPVTRQEPHRHPNSEQIWIALSGAGTLLLEAGATQSFSTGDVVRFADGELHGFQNTGEIPFVYLSITSPPIDFTAAYKNGVNEIYACKTFTPMLVTSGQPSEAQLASLAAAGFQTIINLGLHGDPRYSLQDESALVAALGMEYVHIPVIFSAPSEEDLLAFFAAVEQRQEKKVLVHCAANKRVTAFLGLYLVIRRKWAVPQAFALMEEVWRPDQTWSDFISAILAKHGIGQSLDIGRS